MHNKNLVVLDRYFNITVIEPPDFQRFTRIIYGFVSGLFPRAIVDNFKRVFVYVKNNNEPASFAYFFTDDVGGVQRDVFFFCGRQKVSLTVVFSITCPAQVPRKKEIPSIGHLLVKRNGEVHITLIGCSSQFSGKGTTDHKILFKSFAYVNCPVVCIQGVDDEQWVKIVVHVFAVDEIDGLRQK